MSKTRKPASIVPAKDKASSAPVSQDADVNAFLQKVRSMPPVVKAGEGGRLIFAMDATMSRQPTWDRALQLQGEMFEETGKIGGLDVQLIYFRGFGECRASKWVSNARSLANLMTTVDCRGGHTQISKILAHIKREAGKQKVSAVVYVGDAMEEDVDKLCNQAGEIGLLGVPIFMFQEGGDGVAERAFREIARLTRGAWCRFDSSSAQQLRDLLSAVAVYAAGGRVALENYSKSKGGNIAGLLEQLD